jgi:hypothetical protein
MANPVTVLLEDGDNERAKKAAKSSGRTVSGLLRYLLYQYLDGKQPEKK